MMSHRTGPTTLTEEVWPAGHEQALIHVADLTDEELLGLDGPDSDQIAPTPWLRGRPEQEAELAAEVGLRSLLTHGRADADDDGTVHARELAAILDLRHDAGALVYADHSTPSVQEAKLLYIHPHAVLTEGVNGAGVHRFEVGDLAASLAGLVPWCHPREHDGSPGRLDGDDLPDELDGLQAVVCVDAVSLREDDDVETRSLTFFRLADGSVVEHVVAPQHEDARSGLDLRPRTADDIAERVRATIAEALSARAG